MSYPGRLVIAHIDEREEHIERKWWERYESAFTPEERHRIVAGDFRALKRPYPPRFYKGEWVGVTRGLRIEIGAVEPKNGRWFVRFAQVRDDRPPHPVSGRMRSSEVLENVSTLAGADGKHVTEPEPVPASEVAKLPTSVAAQARFEAQRREETQRRMARSVIEELREAHRDAMRAGVDVSDELAQVREAVEAIRRKRDRQAA